MAIGRLIVVRAIAFMVSTDSSLIAGNNGAKYLITTEMSVE